MENLVIGLIVGAAAGATSYHFLVVPVTRDLEKAYQNAIDEYKKVTGELRTKLKAKL